MWQVVVLLAAVPVFVAVGVLIGLGISRTDSHGQRTDRPSSRAAALPVRARGVPRRFLVWDPSGEPLPPPVVPGWRRVFADDFAHDHVPLGSFSGCAWPRGASLLRLQCRGLERYPAVAAKWFSYPDGWMSRGTSGTFDPSQVVSINRGVMTLHIHTRVQDGAPVHLLAAMVPKTPASVTATGGMLYGRYIVRARIDPLYGYRVSFLLWPDADDPLGDGLISFPDAPFDARAADAFVHYRGASSPSEQTSYRATADLSRWHTYEIDWSPGSCSFYLDQRRIGMFRNPARIPHTPLHFVLQTNVSATVPNPPAQETGNVQIDWVAVYARER